MDITWEEDLLNSMSINWQPLYEDFFSMQDTWNKDMIVCFEIMRIFICRTHIVDGLSYTWRENLLDEWNNSLHRLSTTF